MMIQDSQATRNSRSRSRSRSQPRKRSYVSLVPRGISYKGDCKFTRTCEASYNFTSASGIVLGASGYNEAIWTFSPTGMTLWGSNVNYSVANLPNAAEIAALWDRVKIDKVELTITSNITDPVAASAAAGFNSLQIMLGNDINGPTTGGADTSQVRQLASCKHYKVGGDQPAVKWTIRNPRYQRLVQYTALTSSTEPAIGYVDSTTDIPHYGVRIGVLGFGTLGTGKMIVTSKFFLSAKNVK